MNLFVSVILEFLIFLGILYFVEAVSLERADVEASLIIVFVIQTFKL